MPSLKPITRIDRARGAAHEVFIRTKAGAKTKAKTTYQNATSKPAAKNYANNPGAEARAEHEFGHKGNADESIKEARGLSASVGAFGGFTAGALAGGAIHGAQTAKDRKVMRQLKTERYINKAFPFPKRGPVHLITDVGTGAGRARAKAENREWSRYPRLRPVVLGTSLAAGGTLGYADQKSQRKMARDRLDNTYKHKKNRDARASVSKATVTLDRYEPSKKDRVKDRAKDTGVGAAAGAAVYGGTSGGTRLVARHYKLPHPPFSAKKATKGALISAGLIGGFSAVGTRDKTQYKVNVHKREWGPEQRRTFVENKKRTKRSSTIFAGTALGSSGVSYKRAMDAAKAGDKFKETGDWDDLLAHRKAVKRSIRTSKAGIAAIGASTALMVGTGIKNDRKMKQSYVKKNDTTSAFGVDHG